MSAKEIDDYLIKSKGGLTYIAMIEDSKIIHKVNNELLIIFCNEMFIQKSNFYLFCIKQQALTICFVNLVFCVKDKKL